MKTTFLSLLLLIALSLGFTQTQQNMRIKMETKIDGKKTLIDTTLFYETAVELEASLRAIGLNEDQIVMLSRNDLAPAKTEIVGSNQRRMVVETEERNVSPNADSDWRDMEVREEIEVDEETGEVTVKVIRLKERQGDRVEHDEEREIIRREEVIADRREEAAGSNQQQMETKVLALDRADISVLENAGIDTKIGENQLELEGFAFSPNVLTGKYALRFDVGNMPAFLRVQLYNGNGRLTIEKGIDGFDGTYEDELSFRQGAGTYYLAIEHGSKKSFHKLILK